MRYDDITLARELKGTSNLWGIGVGAKMKKIEY